MNKTTTQNPKDKPIQEITGFKCPCCGNPNGNIAAEERNNHIIVGFFCDYCHLGAQLDIKPIKKWEVVTYPEPRENRIHPALAKELGVVPC